MGNTLTSPNSTVQKNVSQIIITCPGSSNVIGGGAELLPGNANVRGILESSFPNPKVGGTGQWIITAEVTATGTTLDQANDPAHDILTCDSVAQLRLTRS